MEKDSNLRRRCQQIYSLPPLATRESTLNVYGTYRARTYDPLLVRQMLSQLSYDPIQTTQKRLELSTSAVTGRRSNQLSHWAILQFSEGYVPSKLHTVKTNIIIQTYHCFGYALDLLVTVSSMCYHTSTSALSTSSSSRGLTNLTL